MLISNTGYPNVINAFSLSFLSKFYSHSIKNVFQTFAPSKPMYRSNLMQIPTNLLYSYVIAEG